MEKMHKSDQKEAVEKRCDNCRYFLQHYTANSTAFRPINCGHCIHPDVKAPRGKVRRIDICGFWEEYAVQKAERKEAVEDALRSMAKNLAEIELILKFDFQDGIGSLSSQEQ